MAKIPAPFRSPPSFAIYTFILSIVYTWIFEFARFKIAVTRLSCSLWYIRRVSLSLLARHNAFQHCPYETTWYQEWVSSSSNLPY